MQQHTLKSLRVLKGLNLVEASKLIGVSKDTLSSWERGKTSPRLNQLVKIEEAYGVTILDIKEV